MLKVGTAHAPSAHCAAGRWHLAWSFDRGRVWLYVPHHNTLPARIDPETAHSRTDDYVSGTALRKFAKRTHHAIDHAGSAKRSHHPTHDGTCDDAGRFDQAGARAGVRQGARTRVGRPRRGSVD